MDKDEIKESEMGWVFNDLRQDPIFDEDLA